MVLRPPAAPGDGDDAYSRQKARSRRYQADKSASGRDIGPLPECTDPELRERMRLDLLLYLQTCHADSFPLPFSQDHLELIQTLQEVILHGSLHAFAMPRGSGKTTIARHATQWALAYGHRRFVVLVGANNEFGGQLLDQILIDYEMNETLLDLFPEICVPLRALEGIRNRCKGQLVNGEPTNQLFRSRIWRLPTVAGAPSSGAIVKCGSPKSAVRGANMIIEGRTVRPDLVLIDDPQTRATAESPRAVQRLLSTISGDILGCAGPGKSIAVAMPCTVIAPGDAADLMLNRDLYPRWHGTRAKLLYAFPTRVDLWERYYEIYSDAMRAGAIDGTPPAATAFYSEHRSEMDEGAAPAWEARKLADELSAIQHSMTLYLANPHAFFAEYQNEPQDVSTSTPQLTADLWRSRITDRVRGVAPDWTEVITAGIDCHKRLLVWSAEAINSQFTTALIDYGTTPDQAVKLWRVQTARPTLHDLLPPNSGDAAALRHGVLTLIDQLARRTWKNEVGQELPTSLIVIDTGYDPDVVLSAIRESPHRSLCLPYKGTAKGANDCPLSRFRKRPGEARGPEWIKRPQLGLLADTWHWKSFLAARVEAQPGDPGSFTIFGREADGRKADHVALINQLSAEFAKQEIGERTVNRWEVKPGMEAHWLDTAVMSTLGGSVLGKAPGDSRQAVNKPAQPLSMAEMKRRAQLR
jgi:hypothetical protein